MKAKHRRKMHFIAFCLALIPGGITSILYPRALPWIVFMSWVSFWYAPLSAYAAETPVEPEDEDGDPADGFA